MSTQQEIGESARFTVKNIGGINETQVDIPPGVTVLTGENATNRTSFLQSIMAAMGSNQATLKGDADEGNVDLEFEGNQYSRLLEKSGGSVQFSGDSYLSDSTVADLFSFLLETNEARQAVARQDDLREIIMRPVDVNALRREIDRLESRKNEINNRLSEIESWKEELPELEQRRNTVRDRIEDKRGQLAEKEAEIEESNRNIEQSRDIQEELEDKLSKLSTVRSDLESTRQSIQTQKESITSLKQERADLKDELAEIPNEPMGDQEHLESEISRLRDERQLLKTEISDLQSLIQYNNERLEEGDYQLLEDLEEETANSQNAVTDQLLEEDSIVCWTCGSTVDREQIEETVEQLEGLREQKVTELKSIKSQLDEYKSRQREAEQKQHRREEIERKLTEIDNEIAQRETKSESLSDEREKLTAKIDDLETEIEDLESADFDEILSLHQEANQLEFEIDSLESELEDVEGEIEEIEKEIETGEDLRDEREDVVEQLTGKRMRIEQIEQEAVEEFNEHMSSLLDILEYANLDRIWIERVERTVRDGRQKVDKSEFDLHVVRTTESGVAYEDTIEHLSESEREVTGLVFALAGYLVHEAYESVPFMLLDSLESIDSERIARLVDYFADWADFLVVALLPEDAQSLDDDYNRITAI